VSQYRFASRVEQAVEVGGMLFNAADRLSAVLPLVGGLLIKDTPADAAGLQRVADAQAAFDNAAVLVRVRLAELSSLKVDKQLSIIREVRASRQSWDERTQAMLRLPRAARDPEFFQQFILGFDPMFESLDSVLDLGDMAAKHEDGLTTDLLDLARQSWLTRVLMADRTGPVIAAVVAGRPLDAGVLERAAQAHGRLIMRWTSIDALTERLPPLPELTAVLAAAHTAAADFDLLHGRVVEAGRVGNAYPISAPGYGERSSATGKVIVKIRDVALQAARNRATVMRQTAAASVTAVAIVMLLIAAGTVTVLALLGRRIVSPLLSMTKVVGSLAARKFDVAIPAMTQTDEIGGMAAALEALRQSAITAERAEAQISHMARHDALTGLANRVLLQECLDHAVAMSHRGRNCAVLCLDLDRFKAVNDTFGHPAGDLLLQSVAERLRACVREIDVVSRLGGDEFTILMSNTDGPIGAGALAQRIIRSLCEPFDLGGQIVSIGASVGIALAPQDARSAVHLLKSADTALYSAKAAGRGTFRYFEQDMDNHLHARFAMERDLREAIRDESLELVYQPIYDVAHHALCAFEALLRWRHSERGLIASADFISLAEETGLIVPIGAWALRNACLQAAHWPAHVKLAVNLSAAQFKGGALVQIVSDALAESGLPATRLELEITESVVLMQSKEMFATLHTLRDLGAGIAMDDFGTGHSSLGNLRRFPFDKIKIDQSFVQDLCADAEALAIVRTMIELGRSLNIATTAEGVETEAQLAQLQREGCTQVQGYLLSRPMSPLAARQLLIETGTEAISRLRPDRPQAAAAQRRRIVDPA
jgi:diguanylate cyclase (GGDEF)-like protein